MKNVLIASSVVALVFLNGCYPSGGESISDYDLIATIQHPDFDYGAAQTYALADQIPIVDGDEEDDFVDAGVASTILASIRSQMEARGYTEVTENADIVMLPAVTSTDYYYYYSWYDYWYWWGYWPPYGSYPGWGWGYPYYPTYVSGFTAGSLIVTALNGDQVPDNPTDPGDATLVDVVWLMIGQGVQSGSTTTDVTRAVGFVDQAFEQSPYFTTN